MKTQFTTLVLGLLCSAAFSQTNTFPASGNVGVGTTTPTQTLTVSGNINIEDPTAGKYLAFGVPAYNEYNTIGSLYSSAAFMISHGIKPHPSQAKLVYSFPTMSRSAIMVGGFSENGIKFYTKDVTEETVGNVFDDSPRMIIRNDGNVGIGTSLPNAKLDIRGGFHKTNDGISVPTVNVFSINDAAVGAGGTIALGGRTGNGAADYPFAYVMGGKESNLSDNYAGYFAISTVSSGGNGEVNSGNYERLRITSAGNVGIGTIDPKGYKLAVAGSMIAESVKVKLQGTWPDYVFAPSYKIPTLQETEKHIKEKGHLPGIPSASEVNANGVDLGDMNAKLLQKIEELTLHLIEKEKAMNALLKRVEVLEQKNK